MLAADTLRVVSLAMLKKHDDAMRWLNLKLGHKVPGTYVQVELLQLYELIRQQGVHLVHAGIRYVCHVPVTSASRNAHTVGVYDRQFSQSTTCIS